VDRDGPVRLFLCGDVMLGRGVDQLLPRPGDPALRETYAADARVYVELAEAANGPIPRPVGFSWPWGDALAELDEAAPDARVVNLETSITRSGAFAPGKDVHYRMSPGNVPALAAAHPDVCVLANNHLLDFGRRGLDETLGALADAGLRTAGAGRDAGEAWRPAIVPTTRHGGRVLVFSFGMPSSGIPEEWAATGERSGVAFLPEASEAAAAEVTARVSRAKRPGDVAVASVHWGSNWGYGVPPDQVRFAHALLDGGVDVVHGHSSHHPRPVELYRGRLILYGCGDLIDDYEGIGGYEEYRDELRLLYFVSVEPGSGGGRLAGDGDGDGGGGGVRMVPMRARRARLVRASREDTDWLRSVLDGVSRGFGVRVDAAGDGTLTLRSATGSG
jgi:poly-gamma-glutamate capsule biosynthesis protein CapA/YwtB (metallophosphatase superfamily)